MSARRSPFSPTAPVPVNPISRRALASTVLLMAMLLVTACGGDGGSDPRPSVAVAPVIQSRVAGETQQYEATVDDAPATAGEVVWSSSNTGVATIDASTGLATAVAAGTTKIRATFGGSFAEADLTVIANT